MASCYKCGQLDSYHRREVQTGRASSTYSGRYTSTRNTTYYGIRSLCEDCAYSFDRGKARRFVFLQLLILGMLAYALAKQLCVIGVK